MTEWIEHLKHPMVLAGFGLFVFAMVLKPILSSFSDQLSETAIERLIHKSITYVFILALVVIAGGIVLSFNPFEPDPETKSLQDNTAKTTNANSIEQHTSGDKSPAITGKDVQLNYAGVLSSQKKTKQSNIESPTKQIQPVQIHQTTQGNQSAAIHSSGDVSINYAD